ncbi:unnamed protein product [Linum tenue]|uniref:Glycosyltransferase n=3 Tax=Linum tenue TaxID=586396 RepID=A0AAV0JTL2_9ROSI|nr:unnamed protein product [Linum tenue]
MAQGHIIPFLALALHLEQRRNCAVTLVNTPLNIAKLRRSIPPSSSVRLLEIPFRSSDHGLPPGTENTDSLPYDLILKFLISSLRLEPALSSLVADLAAGEVGFPPPICIVTDMFFSWCADIAHRYGIFHAVFNAGGGYGFACYYSLWLNLPHRRKNSVSDGEEFALPDFPEASTLHITQLPPFLQSADGSDPFSAFQQIVLSKWANADAILVNTVEGFDGLGLDYFRRKLGKPVFPIGPVLLTNSPTKTETGMTNSPEICKNWLDSKPARSVLFVSFGSQNTIAEAQMKELAVGLEASGTNFIWVIRPPLGFDINSEFRDEDWLPEGFPERIEASGKGLLVRRWAPQVEILGHESVGGFLSHCGWNSVLESLSCGVPILGWPLAAEQFYNSKVLEEEIGVSVEVGRGKEIVVESGDLKDKIEMVMVGGEKGKEIRRRANEIKEMIKDAVKEDGEGKGSSVEAMDEFLNAAVVFRGRKINGGKSEA